MLRNLAGSDRRTGNYQSMNVVFDPANLQRGHIVLSSNSADICPNTVFDLRFDKIDAAFRAEYDVIEEIRICIGHVDLIFVASRRLNLAVGFNPRKGKARSASRSDD